ncbi:MAG TPA: ADP-ribosylglycohydrolase family protein [Steroidobacteraceae bacterium]|nr:ADP-ribosylglycohydrolase family protein [Steroidobacteraceae bacterium]
MIRSTVPAPDGAPRRPVDETYWVVPGRLLVGAHPGSRSRAQAMDRLRRFLETGVTCFIDLTEPDETAAYETLLPFETPTGRRIEYLREPIVDHGVPAGHETMVRILAMIDGALESGHTVYLHCRAGIGRSAMAAACWLAERAGSGERALAELDQAWSQAAQSRYWPRVPETDEQVQFVLNWVPVDPIRRTAARAAVSPAATGAASLEQRLAGSWYGLALGDALGAGQASLRESGDTSAPLVWTQHTALSLCLAGSLLDKGRCDARDQIERYVRWQREGYASATGEPAEGSVSPDVARALATYLWRGLPRAGSHDPRDVAATSLPRVLAAASFAWREPAAAVALGAECSRTTHQSPLILDACRLYAAMLVCALQGESPATWLEGVPDLQPSPWSRKPLHKAVVAAAVGGDAVEPPATAGSALHALIEARRIVRETAEFDAAIDAAARAGPRETALYAGLVGTLFGARHGLDALPAAARARLAGASQIDAALSRLLERGRGSGVIA